MKKLKILNVFNVLPDSFVNFFNGVFISASINIFTGNKISGWTLALAIVLFLLSVILLLWSLWTAKLKNKLSEDKSTQKPSWTEFLQEEAQKKDLVVLCIVLFLTIIFLILMIVTLIFSYITSGVE